MAVSSHNMQPVQIPEKKNEKKWGAPGPGEVQTHTISLYMLTQLFQSIDYAPGHATA